MRSGLELRLSTPALFALFFAFALILVLATAPLSLVLAGRAAGAGLSAAAVSGTVWRGQLSDAAFQGVRLGDVSLRISPVSLLAARVRLLFDSDPARGAVRLGPRRIELLGVAADLPLVALAPGAGLGGRLELKDFDLELRANECRRAAGEVVLRQLSLAGLDLPGLSLAGTAACSGQDLIVPLRGQAEGVDVQADLRVSPAGVYRMQLILRTTRPEVEAALSAVGYQRTLRGYETTLAGRLR
ncbi:MAG: type II secretion system protein N [Phenylobacterium sp.]|uniref:type II secretion system protein N n=1 Tax=Phenylobacterium sp. TaxID=1871053 RepID=UPI0027258167|nr:type II secretion system protein N [Phenylobacterium sp.]MDO8900114.1 type II secretion system protein N [Phenylobacterium sp.]MDP2214165.1 type II secretion system protein N [Phenylobacterium sp.]